MIRRCAAMRRHRSQRPTISASKSTLKANLASVPSDTPPAKLFRSALPDLASTFLGKYLVSIFHTSIAV